MNSVLFVQGRVSAAAGCPYDREDFLGTLEACDINVRSHCSHLAAKIGTTRSRPSIIRREPLHQLEKYTGLHL